MRELTDEEINYVSGGFNDWQSGGIAIMGLGLSGGPVTAGFGFAIGGAMFSIGYFSHIEEP